MEPTGDLYYSKDPSRMEKNGVHADGSVEMDNVRISMDEHADQHPAQIREAEILRATRARKAARRPDSHLKPTMTTYGRS